MDTHHGQVVTQTTESCADNHIVA